MTDSIPLQTSQPPAPSERISDIERQLAAIAARVNRVESRLGLSDSPVASTVTATPATTFATPQPPATMPPPSAPIAPPATATLTATTPSQPISTTAPPQPVTPPKPPVQPAASIGEPSTGVVMPSLPTDLLLQRAEQSQAVRPSDLPSQPIPAATAPTAAPAPPTAPPATPQWAPIKSVATTPPLPEPAPVRPAGSQDKSGLAALAGATASSPTARAEYRPPNDAPPPRPTRSGLDWENLIGGKWALWMGSASLFLATAFFLAYSWQFFQKPARLAIGLVCGAAFLGAGAFFRNRTERWFGEGLNGAGLAILYLSIWTGMHRYHIIPSDMAFASMIGVTALGVYLAVLYDAMSLNVLAVLGGFITPVLIHAGGAATTSSVALLTYVAVLDAGILAVSLFKRWRAITWLSFVSTLLLVGAWFGDSYSPSLRTPSFFFLTIYFLQFFGASCFYSLKHREATAQEDLILLFGATAIYACSGYALISDAHSAFPGAFPLALFLFFAFLTSAIRAQAPANRALRYSTAGLSIFFLTVTLPIQLHQGWLAIGWSVEAGMLLLLGYWLRASMLRRGGQIVWVLSLLPLLDTLLQNDAVRHHMLFLNERALPLLIGVIVSFLVALIARDKPAASAPSATSDSAPDTAARVLPADELAYLYPVFAVFGGAWLLAQETFLAFQWTKYPSPHSWQAGAVFAIACVLSAYAVTSYKLGLAARHAAIRLCAVGVSAIAAALPIWASCALPANEWTPFWNLRWLAYAVVSAGLFATMRLVSRERDALPAAEREALGVLPTVISAFILAGTTVEVWEGFAHGALRHGSIAGHLAANAWQYPALYAIAILWSAYATMMLFLASSWRSPSLRGLGYCTGVSGVLLLLGHTTGQGSIPAPAFTTPLLNWRFLSFAAVTALLAMQAMLARNAVREGDVSSHETDFPAQIAVIGSLVLLWGLSQETYETCRHFHAFLGAHWTTISYFLIAVLWHFYAAAIFLASFRRRNTTLSGASCLIGALGAMLLLATDAGATRLGWQPVFNLRFAAFLISVAVIASAARLVHRRNLEDEGASDSKIGSYGDTDLFVISAGLLAVGVALWGLTRETYESCLYFHAAFGHNWTAAACFCISVLWYAFAGGLMSNGSLRRNAPFAAVGAAIGAAATLLLCGTALTATTLGWTPFLNVRFAAFAIGALVLAATVRRLQTNRHNYEAAAGGMIPLLVLASASLLLWGLTQEAYEMCYFFRVALGGNWQRWAQMSISLVWSVYGALLLIAGINRGSRTGRIAALGLLAVTVGKVFLFDLSFLDTGLRILSLGGLGIALLFISWLYSRYGTSGLDTTNSGPTTSGSGNSGAASAG